MAEIMNTVTAIVDRVVYGENIGTYSDDAGECFDEPAFAGFYLDVDLDQVTIRGEDFGGIEGLVTVTDPTNRVHRFEVDTDRFGDVVASRALA
jgi:hypothetical protein